MRAGWGSLVACAMTHSQLVTARLTAVVKYVGRLVIGKTGWHDVFVPISVVQLQLKCHDGSCPADLVFFLFNAFKSFTVTYVIFSISHYR